jgi:hypothetical protein
MGRTPQGRPQDFEVHQPVRYLPGTGSYPYEDAREREGDGRIPAIVVGHSRKRVRIRFRCDGVEVTRAVDAASLVPEPRAVQV